MITNSFSRGGPSARSFAVAALIAAAGLAGCATAPTLTAGSGDTRKAAAMSTAALAKSELAKSELAKSEPAKSEPAAPARTAATVKVGVLLPLSGGGQAGVVADTMKKAAELAVSDLNAPHVTLLVRDDKGTPEGADAAARDLTGAGAEIILGPLFSRSVQAATLVARPAQVPIIAFSNDRQVAGAGVSLISFLVETEVTRVVSYAASQGKKRLVALVPDDAYGRIVEASLRQAAGREGGRVLALETYPAQPNAMLEAVSKLRDALRGVEEHGDPVEALFIAGGEDALAALTPQIRQAGIDTKRIKVLGTGALDYPSAGRDPTLAGAWFAAPDPKGFKDFADKYARAHGHAPPRIASLAYDAVGVAVALSHGPDGARFIPSQLTRASGFSGVDGQFRLTSEGTAERALAVLEVQAMGGARIVDQPPPISPDKLARMN